jgi:hypothetical protein
MGHVVLFPSQLPYGHLLKRVRSQSRRCRSRVVERIYLDAREEHDVINEWLGYMVWSRRHCPRSIDLFYVRKQQI